MSLFRFSTLPFLLSCLVAPAAPILQLGDPAIAIDENSSSSSSYPSGENPRLVVDGSAATKYLNFAREGTGFIITPVAGSTVMRSLTFTTANDAVERDPASVTIFGTNEAIVSVDDSAGVAESWTEITTLDLALPVERGVDAPIVSFANDEGYTSYKVIVQTLKGPNHTAMQVAEFKAWDAADGAGTMFLSPTDTVLAVHDPRLESAYPAAEGPATLFDGDTATKYLNFGNENSGFIVTPASGPSVATSFILTTANDFEVRDPVAWELFGTNEAIVSPDNGIGNSEEWTVIASGDLASPLERFTAGPETFFDNAVSYTSYKFIVRAIRDPLGAFADSTQYSEFQLFTEGGPAGIVINSISTDLTANEVTIAWQAPAGGSYTLQSSADLQNWSDLSTEPLTVENDASYTFPKPADAPTLFFRIVDPVDPS